MLEPTASGQTFVDSNSATTVNTNNLNIKAALAWLCLSGLSGASMTLGLAPWDYWLVPIAGFAIFAWILTLRLSPFLTAFFFGSGFFATGASWVYVSIHQYGGTSAPLAVVFTSLFVLMLGFVFALPFFVFRKIVGYNRSAILLFAAPAFWIFSEWLRGWLLTGFPWLYLGYGHIHSPLAGWAPIGGVLLLSLIAVCTGSWLLEAARQLYRNQERLKPILISIKVASWWVIGLWLSSIQWVQPTGDDIKVGLVQPNIPQELKWVPEFRKPTLDRLTFMTEQLADNDWVIWPEAAIPTLYRGAKPFLDKMALKADQENTVIITGVLYQNPDNGRVHNSIVALGEHGEGFYHKTRLVPFGEYVPLEDWIRGLIELFDLPQSIIIPGPSGQSGLVANGHKIAPSVCYEVVYPTLVAHYAKDSEVLLTISNDAWFGDSIGPLQHMEMAQMRALENQRFMIRATNNGVSALVNAKGEITKSTAQFTQEVLSGTITPLQGSTPFMLLGHYPILILCALLLAASLFVKRKEDSVN